MQGSPSFLKGFEAYQVIFDSLTAMIWVKDTRNNFIKVNRAGAKAMGLEPFEIEGKSAYALFPEEAEKYYQDDLEVIRSKRPKLGLVEKMLVSGGEKIWVKTDKIPVFDDQQEPVGILVFAIDIDQAKKVEERLQESEERYRIAIESSNDGVAIVKEGRHLYVNRKFLNMFGYQDPAEVLGKDQSLMVHPDDLDRVRLRRLQRERGESPDSQYTFKGIRRDGSVLDVEVSAVRIFYRGDPVILAYFRDVTDRKEAERKLVESREIWERTFDAIPDLISILDTNFRFIQVNKAMADRFGLRPQELQGRTCYQLVHGTERPPAYCPHFQSMKDRREHSSESFEEQLKGFFHVTTSPFFDPQGEMLGSVHVARDITERKQVEEEREKLISELQEAALKIKTLGGLLPICAGCKKIRNDQGYWEQIESFIRQHSEAEFSHGLCPDCAERLYPEIYEKLGKER